MIAADIAYCHALLYISEGTARASATAGSLGRTIARGPYPDEAMARLRDLADNLRSGAERCDSAARFLDGLAIELHADIAHRDRAR